MLLQIKPSSCNVKTAVNSFVSEGSLSAHNGRLGEQIAVTPSLQ